MTVTSTTNRTEFVGDGSTVEFAFTWKVYATTDVEVYLTATLKTEVTHYTIALSGGGASGGTVTFLTAPASDIAVTLLRNIPTTQGIDLPTAGKFPADTVEEGLDRMQMQVQELQEQIDRSIVQTVESTLSGIQLPAPGAGMGFRWNGGGTAIETVAISDPITANVITTRGDMIRGSAAAVPERFAKGALGALLKMGANDPAWLAAGIHGQVLVSTGEPVSVEWASAGGELVGTIKPYVGTSAPSGYLLCDGSEVSCTTYVNLFTLMVGQIVDWGIGTKLGDVTTDFGTDDKIDLAAHGLEDDDIVHFATLDTLPAGLSPNTKYFVINKTTNDFEVSLTSGGSAVDITDDGTNTHSVYDDFTLPDLRGRIPLGKDNMGGSPAGRVTDTEADNLGQTEGAEEHQLTEAEMPSHAHEFGTATLLAAGAAASRLAGAGVAIPGGSKGGDTAHPNVQPYVTLNYLVKT